MLKKLFFVLLLTFAFSSAAFAIEFSADRITTMKDGQKMTGKIKVPQYNQKMQIPQMPGGMNFKRIK